MTTTITANTVHVAAIVELFETETVADLHSDIDRLAAAHPDIDADKAKAALEDCDAVAFGHALGFLSVRL